MIQFGNFKLVMPGYIQIIITAVITAIVLYEIGLFAYRYIKATHNKDWQAWEAHLEERKRYRNRRQ